MTGPETPPPPRFDREFRILVPVAIFLLGVILHVLPSRRLGLYFDDAHFFLQSHYATYGHPVRFVFADTWGVLHEERPAVYLVSCLARLAYLCGLPALHMFNASLVALTAALLAAAARRLNDNAGYAFAAGVFLLTLPHGSIQPLWAGLGHYSGSLACALGAVLLASRVPRRGRGLVLPALLQAVALLNREIVAGIAPVFLAAVLVSSHLKLTILPPRAARRGWSCLVIFLFELVAYALWRLVLLPAYGHLHYNNPSIPPIGEGLQRVVSGLRFCLFPWSQARMDLAAFKGGALLEDGGTTLLTAGVIVIVLAFVALIALIAATAGQPSPPAELRSNGGRRVLSALFPTLAGLGVLVATVAALTLAPGGLRMIVGIQSRLNYPVVAGTALAYAGLLVPLLSACRDRKWGALSALSALLAATLLGTATYYGAQFQTAVRRAFEHDWVRKQSLFAQLPAVIPSLSDQSFVVLDATWHEPPVGGKPQHGMSHEEFSDYLIVFYDNWSLQGAARPEVRPVKDGILPFYWGREPLWFPPDGRGLGEIDAKVPLAAVAWDRLVTLGFEGKRLTVRDDLLLMAKSGRRVRIQGNPERILPARATPAPAWCHVMPESCSGRP